MFSALAAICVIVPTTFHQSGQGVVERGWGWMPSAWTTVQKQGKHAAEKAIREYPQKFKALPNRASELHKQFSKNVANLKLEEKKAMLQELWRIRQGLNLMALIDTGVLEQLTGIDGKLLKAAQRQVATLTQQLQK